MALLKRFTKYTPILSGYHQAPYLGRIVFCGGLLLLLVKIDRQKGSKLVNTQQIGPPIGRFAIE